MTFLELQQKADWDSSMRETLYDLKTRRLGAPVTDGGAANHLHLTNTGRSTARHNSEPERDVCPSPAASSSIADWIVPALVGCLLGLALYLTWRI